MKNSIIILLFCFTLCFITNYTSGQSVTKTSYSDNLILEKMAAANERNSADVITENITMIVPFEFTTIEDSIRSEHNEVSIIRKSLRFNPDKLISLFPEAVNINEYSRSYIDYTSLIPILWEGIIAQQKQIDMLNSKILELEMGILNQVR